MPNRVEGLIWIDKKTPYSLKYHTNRRDYTVQVANSYLSNASAANKLYSGTVVRFDGENNVAPAEFPDNIDNILGVIVNTVSASDEAVAVTQTGYIVLDTEALDNVFYTGDIETSYNGFTATSGIGAPVYWFIGRTTNSSGNYAYADSHANPGKLTLATPTGMRWGVTSISDNSMNIGYDNLPQVGTVASYKIATVEGVERITEMSIHLNMSCFDSVLDWSWPYLESSTEESKGYIAGTADRAGRNFPIRHGLFADNQARALQISELEIFAGETANTPRSTIITSHEDVITGNDRKTILNLNTPENLYYTVSGTIKYRFEKYGS